MYKTVFAAILLMMNIHLITAATVLLEGSVKGSTGTGIAGVKVALAGTTTLADTTNAQGAFTIAGDIPVSVLQSLSPAKSPCQFSLSGNTLVITSLFANMNGKIAVFTGNGRKTASISFKGTSTGKQSVMLPEFAPGLNLLQITIGKETFTQMLICLEKSTSYLKNGFPNTASAGNFTLGKQSAAGAIDTLVATKTGFKDKKVLIDSYEKTGIAIVLEANEPSGPMPLVYEVENTGLDCEVTTTFPALSALPNVVNFPDPFLMEDGTRITTKAQWVCRRAEIINQVQYWEAGTKPPPSKSVVSATFSNNSLKVDVKVGSNSVSFSSSISYPSSGTAPYPVLIRMDGAGVPESIFKSRGCAVMNFTSSTLAGTFPNRTEKFWQLFPEDKTAGAFVGWSWGVSRLIDGLQQTAANNKIDTKHIAVTGCSYAGKMALYAGAFDERIALTVPQEAGGGGEDSWRYMSTMPTASKPGATSNDRLEDLQAAQGTGWYSTRLKDFNNSNVSKLPIDQHSLVAMIAPRAVLVCMNADVDRGGAEAGQATMLGASEVWKALGIPDRAGYTIPNAGGHCSWAASASNDVGAFVDKFMLGKTADTNIKKSPYTPNMTKWITWETPDLK